MTTCPYVCNNKTIYGYCMSTACINPMYNQQSITKWLEKADYVQVVRCKDCKHRQELRECPMYHLNYERYEWQLDETCDDYTKDNGFCDRGERKDDEHTD